MYELRSYEHHNMGVAKAGPIPIVLGPQHPHLKSFQEA